MRVVGNYLTLYGNLLFSVSSILALGFLIWWLRQPLPEQTKAFLLNILVRDFAVALRIGWWSAAIALKPSDCIPGLDHTQCDYNAWMFDWRYVPTLIAGTLYFMTDLNLIKMIEDIPVKTKILWVVVGQCFAGGVALWLVEI